MTDQRSQVNCRTPTCSGVLGAFSGLGFHPAAHLIPGRDLWTDRAGSQHIRCSRCGAWYRLVTIGGRFELEETAA